ncbi:MAG: hypothetical protein GXX95_00985 [Methanomassiliicoccus sp.]|nr:hypothetical protein [Methanomassiliicoccus sp.]
MKKHYNMTLDEEVVRKAKALAGPIPFSHYLESLMVREISLNEKRRTEQNTRKEVPPQVPAPADQSKPTRKRLRKWYDGMPFLRGGAK